MQPRKDIVNPEAVAYYHCISRCVRRAFLCGEDSYSGKCFEHRRDWIIERLTHLVTAFSVELVGYAAMSNHLHTLLKTRPDLAKKWSDEEVARRWLLIFPRKLRKGDEKRHLQDQILAIVKDPVRITTYRERLSDISWFNRCLNEHIARRANWEDEVKGRFWEGRFKCQLLKDEKAVLACMVYVDLNQLRAGIVTTPEASDFTSIQVRIQSLGPRTEAPKAAPPLLSISSIFGDRISLIQYISIVDETARVHVEGKYSLSLETASILTRLGISEERWVPVVTKLYKNLFRRIVGAPEQLRHHAKERGRSWFQGMTGASSLFCSA